MVAKRWKKGRGFSFARLSLTGPISVMLGLMLILDSCSSGGSSGGQTHAASGSPSPTSLPTSSATPLPTSSSTPSPSPTPSATAALWVENALGNFVSEFSGGTIINPGASVPTPDLINTSSILSDPAGVIFDTSNNQWITNCTGSTSGHGSITEFKLGTLEKLSTNGSPSPDLVISDDGTGKLVNCPWTMTFNSGNLWVANSDEKSAAPGFVTEYQPSQLGSSGAPTPRITLTDTTEFVGPTGVLFDTSGNLFVVDFGPGLFGQTGSGKIWVFKAATVASLTPGINSRTSDVALSDSSSSEPVSGAFDRAGNLWIADCTASELYMFSKSVLTSGALAANIIFQSTSVATPNGTESTINCPGGISFDAQGNLWYTNFSSTVSTISGAVAEFTKAQLSAIGTSTPTPKIFLDGNASGSNFDGPIGLTFGPAL